MKATLDIPDELYRRVKARSAMEGRPIRAVAIELFEGWVKNDEVDNPAPEISEEELKKYPWLEITRKYIKPGMSHDMDEIREAIAKGWAEEAREKVLVIDTEE